MTGAITFSPSFLYDLLGTISSVNKLKLSWIIWYSQTFGAKEANLPKLNIESLFPSSVYK